MEVKSNPYNPWEVPATRFPSSSCFRAWRSSLFKIAGYQRAVSQSVRGLALNKSSINSTTRGHITTGSGHGGTCKLKGTSLWAETWALRHQLKLGRPNFLISIFSIEIGLAVAPANGAVAKDICLLLIGSWRRGWAAWHYSVGSVLSGQIEPQVKGG